MSSSQSLVSLARDVLVAVSPNTLCKDPKNKSLRAYKPKKGIVVEKEETDSEDDFVKEFLSGVSGPTEPVVNSSGYSTKHRILEMKKTGDPAKTLDDKINRSSGNSDPKLRYRSINRRNLFQVPDRKPINDTISFLNENKTTGENDENRNENLKRRRGENKIENGGFKNRMLKEYKIKEDEDRIPDILPPHLIGLQNFGNTCYLNSVLQVLLGLPTFTSNMLNLGPMLKNYGSSDERKPFYFIISLIYLINVKEIKVFDKEKLQRRLENIKHCLEQVNTRFQGTKMQDANECLSIFLDTITESYTQLSSECSLERKARNPVQDFMFKKEELSNCLSCGKHSSVVQSEMELWCSLPSPQIQTSTPPKSKFRDMFNTPEKSPTASSQTLDISEYQKAVEKGIMAPVIGGTTSDSFDLNFREKSAPPSRHLTSRPPLADLKIHPSPKLRIQEDLKAYKSAKSLSDGVSANTAVDLLELISQNFQVEERERRCEECKGEKASTSTHINQLARILIVVLKRYDSNGRKISRAVRVPRSFSLKQFCRNQCSENLKDSGEKELVKEDNLHSVILSSVERRIEDNPNNKSVRCSTFSEELTGVSPLNSPSIDRVSSTPQTLKKPSFISPERTPNSFRLSSTPTPKPSSSPPKPRFYPSQDSPPVKLNGTPAKFKDKSDHDISEMNEEDQIEYMTYISAKQAAETSAEDSDLQRALEESLVSSNNSARKRCWSPDTIGSPEHRVDDSFDISSGTKFKIRKLSGTLEEKERLQLNTEEEELRIALRLSVEESIRSKTDKLQEDWDTDDSETTVEDSSEYRLVSIISHYGSSPTSGHYRAQVYRSDAKRWFDYNDTDVRQIQDPSNRETETGYIFIYSQNESEFPSTI
ncbi:ubiquitin carboxyl-terminal hydrolase 37 [Eurytemora carolleeae]|uniref:ubiquitin carboxyl-terminal hydrolase 37 n=1 Tax=Eurytemora carolleeae TaxID=1294199 RepID=UPI000C776CB3|nr:ubiquitin carboxyl-terminal hydrolase 37 [Eurytemora carolleeae]|eukprot:XP_023327766.1 ubiquitin carboxyl-terminal hydrolase 37-like [Eurytemora affinis]